MRFKFSINAIACLAFLSSGLIGAPFASAVDSIPINGTFSKIYRPDLLSPETCSTGSYQIWRNDNQEFSFGDDVDVTFYAYYPEDKKRSSMSVTSGVDEILPDAFTGKLPDKVGGSYRLCAKDWQGTFFRPNFSSLYVEVVYKMNYGSTIAGKFTSIIPILPKDAEALAIEKVKKDCPFENYTENIVPEVSPATFKNGATITWSGTYFYHGIPVPNHKMTIYEGSSGNPKTAKVKVLGTSITDKEGAFTFKFKFSIPKGDVVRDYTIVAERRVEQIGFIHGPIRSTFEFFDVFCTKGVCSFKPGFMPNDFIPVFQDSCLSAFKAYDDAFGSAAAAAGIAVNFTDDKNRIAWLGKKVFKGSKYKVAFNTIYESEAADFLERDSRNLGKGGSGGSLKGRCWVNGYTTKSGKSVSGYYRSC